MTRLTTLSLLAAFSAGIASTANAAVIFEASDSNTTTFQNTVTGANGAVSGDTASGDMDLLVTGNDFSFGGFASTSTINTLNGTAITDTDVVTVTFTVGALDAGLDGIGIVRSRGYQFGISAATSMDGGASDDQLIIAIGGAANSNASQRLQLQNSANSGPRTLTGTGPGVATLLTEAEATSGFTMTLVADVNGWTVTFSDTADIEGMAGTFDAGEFTNFIGNGHLYAGFQKWDATGGANVDLDGVTVPFEVASIDVSPVPEPGSLALLGLGGLLVARRRRG